MKMKRKLRLWRVEWVHRDGYHAPHQYVEAKTYQKAHREVTKSGHRFLSFPKSWSFNINDTGRTLVKNKWEIID